MSTSLLRALLNIKKYGDNDLKKIICVTNLHQPRVNKEGTPLDGFVKDAFCDSFGIRNPKEKIEAYKLEFSYLGSQNNPPDFMLRGSDAVEVKKVEGLSGTTIALNSSYPKAKLSSKNPMITDECKNCEKWDVKDVMYAVGYMVASKIRLLIFVYGDCYAADPSAYEKIMADITWKLRKSSNAIQTRELGRLNKIDPLQITDLRIRGMWQIKTPRLVFSEHITFDEEDNLTVFAIMKSQKFEGFSKKDIEEVMKELACKDIKIQNPNKPDSLIDSKLIKFSF